MAASTASRQLQEERSEEIAAKRKRLEALMNALKLDGVLLTRRDNFAWITAGSDNHVGLATAVGNATLFVERDRWTLIATNIETPRVSREELDRLEVPVDVEAAPWHQGVDHAIERIIKGKRVGSDTGVAGTANVQKAIEDARRPLTPGECSRMERIGQAASEAVEDVFFSELAPGQTEFEVAGRTARALLARGIEPTVLLVAADERIRQFRHPIPTNRPVERQVMVVVCARQGGLIVALTRLAYFGRLPGDLKARHEAVCAVDAALIDATRPKARVADILEAGVAAYRKHGFPDEWRLHHQGGAIGYAEREFLATPESVYVVSPPQAFAWNPSITGTKSEDTVLVTDQPAARPPQIVTAASDRWPAVEVPVSGPALLRRPAILELAGRGVAK